jgi:hypothetical protein
MVIDTGDHQPIVIAKPHYGMHEALIMQNTIKQLLDMGFIVKDSISPWGFRITLAQNHIRRMLLKSKITCGDSAPIASASI